MYLKMTCFWFRNISSSVFMQKKAYFNDWPEKKLGLVSMDWSKHQYSRQPEDVTIVYRMCKRWKTKRITFVWFHFASPNLAKIPLELFERKHWGETLSSSWQALKNYIDWEGMPVSHTPTSFQLKKEMKVHWQK